MSNPYNCIDVSEWNKEIDWEAAYNDDVRFAFIRAGFGQDIESQDDKYFHINMQNAIEAGVKVGVYFFAYAKSAEMAIGEAEHCCRLIEPYKDKISFPVFYDIEPEGGVEPYISEIVPAFINYLNDKGYNCGIYLQTSWFDDYFKNIDCDYFWMASWGPDDGNPHNRPQWADIWQFTSKGSVYGVGDYCVDCDILYNEDMTLLRKSDPVPEEKIVNIEVTAPKGVKININIKEEE